jgi:hypothetical protein
MDYSRLPLSDNEFRLITLKSRSFCNLQRTNLEGPSDTLRCELFNCSRTESPGYQALSYVWGNPEDIAFIQVAVNSVTTEVQVTKNLHDALDHLQQEEQDLVLWTDALCINQGDNAEKGEQVKHMADIYKNSNCTLVFLGPAFEGSQAIMEEIQKIGIHFEEKKAFPLFHNFLSISSTAEPERYNQVEQAVHDCMKTFLEGALENYFPIAGYIRLLTLPYWNRAWIKQEYIVSPDVLLICGKARVAASRFHSAMIFVPLLKIYVVRRLGPSLAGLRNDEMDQQKFRYIIDLCETPETKASEVVGRRYNFQENKDESRFSLFRLMSSAFLNNSTDASDPRDRVFSLLGMASDRDDLKISPDYSQTCAMVYSELARAFIETGQVDTLAYSQFPKSSFEKNMPSWVPDWTSRIYLSPSQLPWNTFFNASESHPFAGIAHDSSIHTSQLKLRGCVVDVVEFVDHSLECCMLSSDEDSLCWATADRDEHINIRKNSFGAQHYLDAISNLWNRATTSAAANGLHFYKNSNVGIECAYALIPVADQELYGVGFTRRATMQTVAALKTLNDELADAHRESRYPDIAIEKISYFNVMTRQRERCPFVTEKGFAGLGPDSMRDGDVAVVLAGAKFPYILRKMDSKQETWSLVGHAYVQGIMYGEYMEQNPVFRDFVLM